MKRPLVCLASAALVLALVGGSPLFAQGAAEEVMAVARAEWAAFNDKNVTEASKNWADDYTQFNGTWSTRLEGKQMMVKMEQAWTSDSGVGLFSDMINPKVQVYGDVAILSYNYVGIGKDKDGKTEPNRAKSTRVYVKQRNKWMLVHSNFAPDPLPE